MRIVCAIAALLHACQCFDAYSANHPDEMNGDSEKGDVQSELNALLKEVHPALFFRPDTNLENVIADFELNDVSDVGDITRHELIDDSTAPIKPLSSRIEDSQKGKIDNDKNESITTTTPRLIVFAKRRRRPTIVLPNENTNEK